jgi:hypothetical protein
MYRLLKSVNKGHAAVMVVVALLCVPISFLAEANNLAALRLLSGAGEGVFTGTHLQMQAMLPVWFLVKGVPVERWLGPPTAMGLHSRVGPEPRNSS